MLDALGLDFMRQALLAGLLASVACGVIGSLVVVNRVSFISGGIAHAAYGGIGLAFFLNFDPLWGALGFAVLCALIIAWITSRRKERADTIIGVVWAVGMAGGVVLIDLTPGYNVDLMSYLFGSILAVPTSDLWLALALDGAVLWFIGRYYNQLQAMSFDEEFALTRGVAVNRLYVLTLVLVALTVVVLIRMVGLILVIALLTIPPYIAEGYSRSLRAMMFLAAVLCALFSLVGLSASFWLNITSGPSIILTAALGFFISQIARRLAGAK